MDMSDLSYVIEENIRKKKENPWLYQGYPYQYGNQGWQTGFPNVGLDYYGNIPVGGALTGGQAAFPTGYASDIPSAVGDPFVGAMEGMVGQPAQPGVIDNPGWLELVLNTNLGIPPVSQAGKQAVLDAYGQQTTGGKGLSALLSLLGSYFGIPSFVKGPATRGVINPILSSILGKGQTSAGPGSNLSSDIASLTQMQQDLPVYPTSEEFQNAFNQLSQSQNPYNFPGQSVDIAGRSASPTGGAGPNLISSTMASPYGIGGNYSGPGGMYTGGPWAYTMPGQPTMGEVPGGYGYGMGDIGGNYSGYGEGGPAGGGGSGGQGGAASGFTWGGFPMIPSFPFNVTQY